jgi:hypothetical protein
VLAAVEHRDYVASLRELPHDGWPDEDRPADDEDAGHECFIAAVAATARFSPDGVMTALQRRLS